MSWFDDQMGADAIVIGAVVAPFERQVPQVLADRFGVLEAGRRGVAVQPVPHLAGLLDVPGGEAGVQQDDVTGREFHPGLAPGKFQVVDTDR